MYITKYPIKSFLTLLELSNNNNYSFPWQKETGDNTILVRALDRFHRRLQAMNKLLPDTDFSRAGTDIVSKAARDRVVHYLEALKQHFAGGYKTNYPGFLQRPIYLSLTPFYYRGNLVHQIV